MHQPKKPHTRSSRWLFVLFFANLLPLQSAPTGLPQTSIAHPTAHIQSVPSVTTSPVTSVVVSVSTNPASSSSTPVMSSSSAQSTNVVPSAAAVQGPVGVSTNPVASSAAVSKPVSTLLGRSSINVSDTAAINLLLKDVQSWLHYYYQKYIKTSNDIKKEILLLGEYFKMKNIGDSADVAYNDYSQKLTSDQTNVFQACLRNDPVHGCDNQNKKCQVLHGMKIWATERLQDITLHKLENLARNAQSALPFPLQGPVETSHHAVTSLLLWWSRFCHRYDFLNSVNQAITQSSCPATLS